MMNRVLSVMVLLAALACRRQEQAPAAQTGSPQTPPAASATSTAPPTDASTAAVNAVIPFDETRFLDAAAVGAQLGQNGMVQAESTSFKRGQRIFASVRAKEVPEGLAASMVWLDASGKELSRDRKQVPGDTRLVSFETRTTSKWKPGKYTVQLWLGGDNVYQQEITLTK